MLKKMELTAVEREKITDGMLKIQSARASLEDVDATKIPEFEELEDCLEDADKNLGQALRKDSSEKKA
jgi:hypothetical protein